MCDVGCGDMFKRYLYVSICVVEMSFDETINVRLSLRDAHLAEYARHADSLTCTPVVCLYFLIFRVIDHTGQTGLTIGDGDGFVVVVAKSL